MVSKRMRTTGEGGAARPTRSKLVHRLVVGTAGVTAAACIFLPGTAGAATPTAVEVLGQQLNLLWVVIGAVLVIAFGGGAVAFSRRGLQATHGRRGTR